MVDLRDLDPHPVRKTMTVVAERIIYELRGLACLPLELMPAQRKGCAVSRSFSRRITERETLEQAVAAHATRLGEKLRRGGLGTTHVSVFYHPSEHDRGDPMRSISTTVTLPEATNDTLALIKAAQAGVARTWRVARGAGRPALALQQGRRSHDGPDAARYGAPGAHRPTRPNPQRAADGGDERLQRALRPGYCRAGPRGPDREAHVVDEIRDADAPLHDAGFRATGRARVIDETQGPCRPT